jgi:xanthine dehydrogenase YagT iron-sulfur-binding subunit
MSKNHSRGKKPPGKAGDGFSRRGFLRGLGIAGAAAAAAPAHLAAAVPEAGPSLQEGVGPGAVDIALRVNGAEVKLKVEPRVTLLDALRDHVKLGTQDFVDLTGSKRACDRGSCGACTMIVNGRTVYSCTTLAVEAQGKEIRTVEGLEKDGKLHPVQEEFISCDGMQCGFCTPGFVMSAVACLEKNPNATRDEIRKCLDGNICRCGTQGRALEAIGKAALRMKGRR